MLGTTCQNLTFNTSGTPADATSCARGVKGQVGGSIPTGNNPPNMNGRRRVMGWGVLGCRPNTTDLRGAGGMPGKPKRIRGCYRRHMIYRQAVFGKS